MIKYPPCFSVYILSQKGLATLFFYNFFFVVFGKKYLNIIDIILSFTCNSRTFFLLIDFAPFQLCTCQWCFTFCTCNFKTILKNSFSLTFRNTPLVRKTQTPLKNLLGASTRPPRKWQSERSWNGWCRNEGCWHHGSI